VNGERDENEVAVTAPGKSTVNDWKRAQLALRYQLLDASRSDGKRNRKSTHPELEEVLYLWFKQQEQRGLDARDDVLQQQAKGIGKGLGVVEEGEKRFSRSEGWLTRF
jgi:hypothetical protein